MRALAAAGLALLLAPDVLAEGAGGWYTQVDNDVFFHTDRWYTSGVRIARVAPAAIGRWRWASCRRSTRRKPGSTIPSTVRPPRASSRPSRATTAAKASGRRWSSTWASRVPRRWADRRRSSSTAWSPRRTRTGHQRANRVDAQFAWVRSHDFQGDPAKPAHLYAHYGVVAGNQLAFAHGGVELRYGHGAAMGLSTPALRFAATPPLAPGDGSWAAFAAASVRAVAVNHLLDFAPGVDEPPARRKPTVGRFLAGVAWAGEAATVTFSLAEDTREFAGQRRDQAFGSVTLLVPF